MHPLRWGFLLAAAMTMAMIATGRTQMTAASLDGEAASFLWAMTAMILPGAFLAALPGRLRRWKRKEPRGKIVWKSLPIRFLGGVMLAAAAFWGGDAAAGILQGSISAWILLAVAWLTGGVLVFLRKRRRT